LSLLMDNPNLILPKAVKNHLNELGVKEKAEAYHNYAATIIQKAFRSQDPKKVQRIIRANAADRRVKLNQSKGPVEETKGEFDILASGGVSPADTIRSARQTPETKKAPEEKSPL
ncbi:MAG: hypothetical protein KA998_03985, partial [Rickettsiaceae bacterium]|nr:hypothetical protein [Rickettsiaceae bacterium]